MNKALAAFERTLISGRSAFDRWYFDGDDSALVRIGAARHDALLRRSGPRLLPLPRRVQLQRLRRARAAQPVRAPFHNTGLYNIDGAGAYPAPNTGVHEVTRDPADMGRFKAPTLRNIAVTAPYMHDGSIATLVRGARSLRRRRAHDPRRAARGQRQRDPLKSERLTGFALGAQQRADLLAFLDSLTDDDFLGDPKFSDPWQE